MEYNEIIITKSRNIGKKKTLFFTLTLGILIVIPIILTLYFRNQDLERIYFSIEIGLILMIIIDGLIWGVIALYYNDKLSIKRLIIITIIIGMIVFSIGFLFEYLWMYEYIALPKII